MASDPYSQLVGFLKVVLPLIALALLSTLFLVSDRIEPGSSIPFAEGDVVDRVTGQQITGPVFTGSTEAGDVIILRADQVRRETGTQSRAETLSARIELTDGTEIVLIADQAVVALEDNRADLRGNVHIDSSAGYRMRTDAIETGLSRLDISAPGEIRATGPVGTLTAGAFALRRPEDGSGAQLLFTQGVKLIYDPKQNE